jgi:hypothetical protein
VTGERSLRGCCGGAEAKKFLGGQSSDTPIAKRGIEADWDVPDQREAVHEMLKERGVLPLQLLQECLDEPEMRSRACGLQNDSAMWRALR